MAKVGAGAAGLQLSYNESKMPQITQYWGGKGIEEQDKIKAGKAAKQAAKKKKIDEWDAKFKPENIQLEFSKNGTWDNGIYRLNEEAARLYAQQHRIARYGSDEDRRTALLNMHKIERNVKMANAMTGYLGDSFSNYKELDKQGKVSGADRFGRIFKSAFVKDKNGQKKIAFSITDNFDFVGLTEDEEGNRFQVDFQDMADGSFSPMENHDLLKEAKSMTDQIGKRTTTVVGDEMSFKNIRWGESQDKTARELIDTRIKESDNTMSDFLYQITAKKGEPVVKYKDFTKDEYDMVTEHMYGLVKGGFDTEYGEKSLPKSDRTYGFGYDKDGKSLVTPILDTETGNLGYQPITVGGKLVTVGHGYNLETTTRKKLKTLFENEPNTMPSAVLIGEDDNLYVRVSEQGSDRREVDGEDDSTSEIEELAKQADVSLTTYSKRKPIKEKSQYRKLDNTQGTAVAGALNAKSIIDLKNKLKALPETYGLPTNIEGQDQGISTKRTFGQGISSVDTPLPEEARAKTRTVDGETFLIEDGQPVQSTNSDPLGLGI